MTEDQPKSLRGNVLGTTARLCGRPRSIILAFIDGDHLLFPPFLREDAWGMAASFFWPYMVSWFSN
jgi:hypothetical protein